MSGRLAAAALLADRARVARPSAAAAAAAARPAPAPAPGATP
jgi:hypothetical protein